MIPANLDKRLESMLNFPNLTASEFINEYWQKKPLLIKAALPSFTNHLSPEELAGLAMEQEIESRLVSQTPGKNPEWHLKRGPLTEKDFKNLPKSKWTLLVQGVDRFIPEIASLLDYFNFLPQWRVDDIMISYAVRDGSVGPHYDHYDVFLYQARGRRKWMLTSKNCTESNYLPNLELRIMDEFNTEQTFILEEGDMLYLPPQIAHYGISMDDECMTYSFGYRSYKDQELWESFGEYLFFKNKTPTYYKDPSLDLITETSQLTRASWLEAKALMQKMLERDDLIQDWFGAFATRLDHQAEDLIPECLEDNLIETVTEFKQNLLDSRGLIRNPICRFAYIKKEGLLSLYMNGEKLSVDTVSIPLIEKTANNRTLFLSDISPFMDNSSDISFLYNLWKIQMLEFLD